MDFRILLVISLFQSIFVLSISRYMLCIFRAVKNEREVVGFEPTQDRAVGFEPTPSLVTKSEPPFVLRNYS